MAASLIAAPGTERGPCLEPCEHTDCAAVRAFAATPCCICGEPLGYEQKFFQSSQGKFYFHLLCLPDPRYDGPVPQS